MADATAIDRCDVVIIGGGIAGIAIAEFLARNCDLSIKLLEQAAALGTGASGKLEGWFHTGALYSGHDDAQTFMNCVNSLEDLLNFYSPHFARCNIALMEKSPQHFTPSILAQQPGWFSEEPVFIVHPRSQSPEATSSGLKSDPLYLEIQRRRVLGRLEAAYGGNYNWLHEGCCKAPSYSQIEDHDDLDCSLLAAPGDMARLCRRFDASFGVNGAAYDVIKTLDATMNTSLIMRDLVASALAHGVEIEVNARLDRVVTDRFGPLRIASILYTRESAQVLLKAQLYIFAVGHGFESFLEQLQLRARLRSHKSTMIVAYPALVAHSFVRMSTKNKFHFNHFIQHHGDGDDIGAYSMLADSEFCAANDELDCAGVESLLESAERYFGNDALYARQLLSYDCVKTEFISDEEQKRRYSYWIESHPDGNFLCVLPGKFSFFPTVACQAYGRVKNMLRLAEGGGGPYRQVSAEIERSAGALVAQHYPVGVLKDWCAQKQTRQPRARWASIGC